MDEEIIQIQHEWENDGDFLNEYNAKGLIRKNIYKHLDEVITSFAKGKIDVN
ncbi:hypothetical protein [Lebetimonas sp. JH292]|uniref:hypothetical protein n=1 Tax=Lebetimonas sp. JH292 TaxID=990068 RepID=UPI0004ACF4AD|nr:hypothetical protein [Lebetimonas sp. JH292]